MIARPTLPGEKGYHTSLQTLRNPNIATKISHCYKLHQDSDSKLNVHKNFNIQLLGMHSSRAFFPYIPLSSRKYRRTERRLHNVNEHLLHISRNDTMNQQDVYEISDIEQKFKVLVEKKAQYLETTNTE